MGHTDDILSEIRKTTDAHPDVLCEARARTKLVRVSAEKVTPGALRSYTSGSLAHHTQNDPINDGDAGLVLNRVNYPKLGPEGGGEAPGTVVDEICLLLGSEIRKTYPNAACHKSKRGPMVYFREPIEGQDPTVDLVIALTRREGDGLWIPHLPRGRWEASHPEGHGALLNTKDLAYPSLRSTRRKVIRLLKVWNKQYSTPVFSSFHLSVLAYEFVKPGRSVAGALHDCFVGINKRMAKNGATPDPCGVSVNIRLLGSWESAERNTRLAAQAMEGAFEHDKDDTDAEARAYLAKVFFKYLEQPAQLASVAKHSNSGMSLAALGLAAVGTVAATRAFGNLLRPR